MHLQYLNAGPGAPALLYVRTELQERMRQPIWGWFGQNDPVRDGADLRPGARHRTVPAQGRRRSSAVAVEEGTKLLAEAGLNGCARGIALTSYLIHLADEWLTPYGFRSLAARRRPARQSRDPVPPGGLAVQQDPDRQ
jgi:kynureninase